MTHPPTLAARHVRRVSACAAAALLTLGGDRLGAAQPPVELRAPVSESAQSAQTVRTSHLTVQAGASVTTITPGSPFSVSIEVTPRRGMHVYAPGKHTYQVVAFTLDPQPWLASDTLKYPPSELYHFVPLDEKVETYQKPFTLVQRMTVRDTPEARAALGSQKSVTVSGRLEYQACDDNICYRPTTVPVALALPLAPASPR